jgi:hypothetical protein
MFGQNLVGAPEAPWLSCSIRKASPMSMVGFPLLLIPLAICNIVVFLMPGLSFAAPLFTLPLLSGVSWPVTLSDLLVALGILMLLLEVIKGARPGAKYFMDHLLSLLVFGGAAAEFLLLPQFGTSTYFLLTALALVDFLTGIALRTRRPLVAAASARPPSASVETAAAPPRREAPQEPRFDPTPTGSMAKTESKVSPKYDAAPPAPVEPTVVDPDMDAKEPSEAALEEASQEAFQESPPEPSPEIQSPGIQPGSGAHPSKDVPPR